MWVLLYTFYFSTGVLYYGRCGTALWVAVPFDFFHLKSWVQLYSTCCTSSIIHHVQYHEWSSVVTARQPGLAEYCSTWYDGGRKVTSVPVANTARDDRNEWKQPSVVYTVDKNSVHWAWSTWRKPTSQKLNPKGSFLTMKGTPPNQAEETEVVKWQQPTNSHLTETVRLCLSATDT